MGKNSDNDKKKKPEIPPADFHGAAFIDDEGHEIPITEEMVQEACHKLDKCFDEH